MIFFAVLNESVFNVSTPSIAEQLGLILSSISWVVTIFFIVFGMGMVIFGKTCDMFNCQETNYHWNRPLQYRLYPGICIAILVPGCHFVQAIQGAGGSAIPALIFVMVARFFTAEERGKMFGIITSTVSFAIGIGPVLGGYIAAHSTGHFCFWFRCPYSWRFLTFVNFCRRNSAELGKWTLSERRYWALSYPC